MSEQNCLITDHRKVSSDHKSLKPDHRKTMKARLLGGQTVYGHPWALMLGWVLAIVGSVVYLITMEPSTSFWDCGEFISVSSLLQVGHPPGAPFYQLMAHIFTLLAGGNGSAVAACSNALSAVAGGGTVMFLFWSILLLIPRQRPYRVVGALLGSLCYMFCDTAWFSAVESEVYSLAMLEAAVIVWAMLRWYRCEDRGLAPRWLLLVALLMGLGYCTHQLVLLTSPTLLMLFVAKMVHYRRIGEPLPIQQFLMRVLPLGVIFFVIGLTPYLIIPIRAAAGTPINEGNPRNMERFRSYLARDQYEKAPLYPRMWRHRANDALYAASWSGGDTNLAGNLRYYGSYQLSYMYLRYLMWNFSGRYNDRQGYGSPQNGQFITGIPLIDRMLVGTSARPPQSLHMRGHNVYYLLPLLLGLLGLAGCMRYKRQFWAVLLLFLMGGIVLNLYLNHPCYEPRERDYAYILSFYAFCIFIAFGGEWLACHISRWVSKLRIPSRAASGCTLVLLAVPLLMACQNWDDHDRRGRYIARDSAANILNSCDQDSRGTILFTYGDNDTFPLWYLQTVEGMRSDVWVENIGLLGWARFAQLMQESQAVGRPIYFTHYAFNQYRQLYPQRLQLEGNAYRLMPQGCDSVAVEPCLRHLEALTWHPLKDVYVDEVGCRFLESYWRDMLLIAQNLIAQDRQQDAVAVLDKTLAEIPLDQLQDVTLCYHITQAYQLAGNKHQAHQLQQQLAATLRDQLRYFHTLSPRRQRLMPYTLVPREEVYEQLTSASL